MKMTRVGIKISVGYLAIQPVVSQNNVAVFEQCQQLFHPAAFTQELQTKLTK